MSFEKLVMIIQEGARLELHSETRCQRVRCTDAAAATALRKHLWRTRRKAG